MADSFLDLCARKVLASKKVRHIPRVYVKKLLHTELAKERELRALFSQPALDERVFRRKIVKTFLRRIRGLLFERVGVYRSQQSNAQQEILGALQRLPRPQLQELCEKALRLHASSRERLLFYREVYRQIFFLTGVPSTILDVGCGLNPFSLPFMHLPPLRYTALELNEQDCALVETFFRHLDAKILLEGNVRCADIADPSILERLSQCSPFDVCFLFKIAEIVERKKGHAFFEGLLRTLPVRYFVVSFSTKTLSNKPMKKPERRWFMLLLTRLGWTWSSFAIENEVFYVIKKDYTSRESNANMTPMPTKKETS